MLKPVWDRPHRSPPIPRVVSTFAVIGILGALGFWVFDLVRVQNQSAVRPPPTAAQRNAALPGAQAEWARVRAHLEDRLRQTRPLELGAVWMTRAGQVCGLVNGRGSFGGLTGMARFYSVDHRPVFHQDLDHVTFQKAWFECRRDQWVPLHTGTDEPGFCSTELGRRRCHTVRITNQGRTIEPAPGGPPPQ